ncbi:MAG: metallophosphoesterase [Acidobacteria bacterium]|nr:metallophosphoesterase [Acidobacteriota bacterium]
MLDWREVSRRRGVAATTTLMAGLALVAPLRPVSTPETTIGVLLMVAATLEWLHGLRRPSAAERLSAWRNGAVTLLMASLLVAAPMLSGSALVVFLALSFIADGITNLVRWIRRPDSPRRDRRLVTSALDMVSGLALLLLLGANVAVVWTVAMAAAVRLLEIARRIATARVLGPDQAGDSLIEALQLVDVQELKALGDQLEVEAAARAPVDRGWVLAFLATLLAIHAGRMGSDFTIRGVVAPVAAVAGDVIVAMLFTMGVALPFHLLLQRASHPLERRAWRWWLAASPATASGRLTRRGVRALLLARLRSEMQWQVARLSLLGALGRGVRLGLPVAAIIAATVPVWGMSWYFDTENWAAGLYNSWAETRTDQWREAMARAVAAADRAAGRPSPDFSVTLPGVEGEEPFSFVVIGDTGEGDASQHVLRDQLLAVAARDDVRFVVVSSDVVYPSGAMRDYEAKFWLPFKGVRKPVLAIPGNHDWYDALEGFNATFLTPEAARRAMGARVNADLNISTSTAGHIERLIGQAGRLRREYGVPTGFQRAPFFDVQTAGFALIGIDTGIVKRVDAEQERWLDAALARARGKAILALLGHPFYAGGRDQTREAPDFERLREKLRAAGVAMAMAGDTHDLEYYAEPPGATGRAMRHIVNGGGGAYLSFGTSLAFPPDPAVDRWAFYPSTAATMAKIDAQTPWWKRPAWWWTHRFGAWPFSAEWLSAAFDSNTAPFYQSFVLVRVEPGRIIVRPHGVHGRLRWREFGASPTARPPGASDEDLVEWDTER